MFSGLPFFRRAKQRNRPCSRFDRRPRPRKLRLEILEDRRLLATFSESETEPTLELSLAQDETVSILSSEFDTYTLTLTAGGLWSGPDNANVAGNSTPVLTVTTAGKAVFDTIRIKDLAAGASVQFADSGNAYSDNFIIALGNSSAGQIRFSGASSFGAFHLSASTTAGIVVNSGASVTASGGSISLNASTSQFQNLGTINAGTGSVTITADTIDIQSAITANGGIILQPATQTQPIGLNDPAGAFNLTLDELKLLTSNGTVTIGASNGTGAIRVGDSGAIDLSTKFFGLTLQGGDVVFSNPLRIRGTATLLLSTGAVSSASGDGLDIQAGTLWLDTQGPVGAENNPLTVDLGNLRGTTGGDLFVRDVAQVTISGELDAGSNTIHLVGGTFRLGASQRIADSSFVNVDGGTFDLWIYQETVAGVRLTRGIIDNGTLTSGTAFQVESGYINTRLNGSVGLHKSTDGTVILNLANSYTGATTITGGVLEIGASDNRLGAAPSTPTPNHLVIDGGTLRINSDAPLTLHANRGLALGSESGAGTGTLETATDKELIYNGIIANRGTGPARLVKTGPGILTLGGKNSYSGGTAVEQGELRIAADSALGTAPVSREPGHVELRGTLCATNTFELDSNRGIALGDPDGPGTGTIKVVTDRTLTYHGVIADNGSGADGLIKSGAGTLILGGENTYRGGTFFDDDSVQFNAGVIRIDDPLALGSSGTIQFLDDGTLRYGAGITEDLSSRIVTGPPTVRTRIDTNGNDVEFATPLAGGGRLEKLGVGTLRLTTPETTTLHVLFVLGGELAVPTGTLQLTGTATDTYGPGSFYGPASVFVQRATLRISGGTVKTAGSLLAGYQIGDTGTLDVTGGRLDVGLDLQTGGGVNATGNIGGATTQVIVARDFVAGFNGGAPTVNIGDAATIRVGQDFIAGIDGGSPTINISGANTQLSVVRHLTAGDNGGSPTINIRGGTVDASSLRHLEKGNAVVNLSGGILTVDEIFHRTASDDPDASDDSLTLNLAAGGTLLTDRMYLYRAGPTTQSWSHSFVVGFDGGLLKPKSADVVNLFDEIVSDVDPNDKLPQLISNGVVKAGGAIIDTSGFDTAVLRPLLHDSTLGSDHDGGLNKQGLGTLSLAADNTFTGPAIIATGVLALVHDASNNIISQANIIDVQCKAFLDVTQSDSAALAGTLILAEGQTLKGTGTVTGDLIAASGSTVSPGASPGVLHQVGDLTMNTGSILEIQIGGNRPPDNCNTSADSYHDQYHVTGTIRLGGAAGIGGATLNVTPFADYVPQLKDRYVIIKNDGNNPVTGTFKDLPEGALLPNFLGSGLTATISYQAGGYDEPTGNDVVIFFDLATLGDRVWVDLNEDGIQDPNEPGLNGVTVQLLDTGGNVVEITQTLNGADETPGYYLFTGLVPGTYSIQFVLPAGYIFSPPSQGGDDTRDSDADPITGQTPSVTLGSNERNLNLDAGLAPLALAFASLGDLVWRDLNANGIQDDGEPGLAGVTVTLTGTATPGNSVHLTTMTGRDGRYLFEGLMPGTYAVTVTNPGGFVFSPQHAGEDRTRDSDVNAAGETAAVTLVSGERNLTLDAGLVTIVVLAPDKNPGTPQEVLVADAGTGAVWHRFLAYESDYLGGTRVAVADLNGDGSDEIITAPGRNRAPDVRVFSIAGQPVPGFPSFLAYDSTFTAGVHLTIADVNGDGKPDVITVPSYGTADVRVFLNRYDAQDPSKPAFQPEPDISFLAFPVASIGGAVVAAGDMGSMDHGSFTNKLDRKAEIAVGTGGGPRTTVSVFEVTGTSAVQVQTFFPFSAVSASFAGGVSLDVAHIDQTFEQTPAEDSPPVIIAGMGVNGTSRIEVWAWDPSDTSLFLRGVIPQAFPGSSSNAPVDVAAATAADGMAYAIFAVQGPSGTTREIHRFDITSTAPTLQFEPAEPLSGFQGPWFIATRKLLPPASQPQPLGNILPPAGDVWTNFASPHDVNNDGLIAPLDVLEIINYINTRAGQTGLPSQQFSPPRFFDTNADGAITAADVLVVLNYLNRVPAGSGEGEAGEVVGEIVPISRLLPLSVGDNDEPRHAASAADRECDRVFAAFATDGFPLTAWRLPVADEKSPPALRFSKRWPDALEGFDLEAILKEVA